MKKYGSFHAGNHNKPRRQDRASGHPCGNIARACNSLAPLPPWATKEIVSYDSPYDDTTKADRLLALEAPLAHAMGVAAALRLLGYGLRKTGGDEASAILALSESLEQDHQEILRLWKSLLVSSARSTKR
jgi:hypothetical protein